MARTKVSEIAFTIASCMTALFGCRTADSSEEGSASLAAAAGSTAAGDRFFDLNHVIKIEVSTGDWDRLRTQQPRGGRCNFEYTGPNYDWFHASEIKIDGISFADAGIKKRSFCNSMDDVKPALGINVAKFNKDLKDQAEAAFGTASLSLSNSKQDPTYIRQCLAYQLFAEAGIASPRCNYAHVYVNGRDLGIYVNIENYTKDWAKRKYGAVGNMYELSGEAWDYWALDRLKGRQEFGDDESLTAVKKLIEAIKNDNNWELTNLANAVDIKQFIDYWSMEIILVHWDAMARGNNNSYAYFGSDGKLRMAPWGTDQVYTEWGQGEAQQIYQTNLVAQKLFNSKYRANLFGTIKWYLNQFEPNKIYDRIAKIEQVLAPYNGLIYSGELEWSKRKLKDLIWNRRDSLQRLLQ